MAKLTKLAKQLIDGKNLANVATLMPDGSPQVASVWVEREGDIVVINATTTRQRYKNLKRDPRVALSVFDMDDIYTSVMIRGRATEITREGAEEDIDRLSMKYNGRIYPDHSAERPRVIIRITPEHVTEWVGRRYNAARNRTIVRRNG
jgi:PPOX class probable F420-dependent enzyme